MYAEYRLEVETSSFKMKLRLQQIPLVQEFLCGQMSVW